MALTALTEAQWAAYDRDGFVVLDGVADAAELEALNARLDELMDGRVQYGGALLMQLDASSTAAPPPGGGATLPSSAVVASAAEYGAYASAGAEVGQTTGFKGPSRAYRKIGEAQAGLEVDPVFRSFMTKPLFRAVCDRVYGAHAGIGECRAGEWWRRQCVMRTGRSGVEEGSSTPSPPPPCPLPPQRCTAPW
jgi:hypothetical protein